MARGGGAGPAGGHRPGGGQERGLRARLCWHVHVLSPAAGAAAERSPPPLPCLPAGLGHHWGRVLSLLGDMEAAGVGWDAFTCSALLSACQACGQWEQALEWFGQARATPGE